MRRPERPSRRHANKRVIRCEVCGQHMLGSISFSEERWRVRKEPLALRNSVIIALRMRVTICDLRFTSPGSKSEVRPQYVPPCLCWDELKVIVPFPAFQPKYPLRKKMAEAWELIGSTMYPDDDQKRRRSREYREPSQGGISSRLYSIAMMHRWRTITRYGQTNYSLTPGTFCASIKSLRYPPTANTTDFVSEPRWP